MNKVYVTRLLALVMVILMVFQPIGLSAKNMVNNGEIKTIYFESEDGKLVAVDYAGAIEQSLEGDHILYNAVKKYVGRAEVKGRPLYLKMYNGKILDYRLAMLDNLFKLQEIIGKEKYEVNKEINYTHELKVIDGVAVIVAREINSNYIINIDGPNRLTLGEKANYNLKAYGDGKGNVNYRARYEYSIDGGRGKLEYLHGDTWKELPLSGQFGPDIGFIITPDWNETNKVRFTPAEEGEYSMELSLVNIENNKVLAHAEHELIVSKPVEVPVELVSIEPVDSIIEVELGTTEDIVKGLLAKTTTIKDSKDNVHTVNLDWTIENYNKDVEASYNAIGRFDLPGGIKNSKNLELKVETTVKLYSPVVEPEWPIEIENIFIGQSQLTNNTYANIKIKAEFVSLVESVYIDGELANKMEDDPSQWRIQVADGTKVEELKGRIGITRIVVKEALNTKIAEVEALNEKDYTEETWAALQQALTVAKAVASDDEAIQEEVDQALVALVAAIDNLEEAPYVTSVTHNLINGKDAYRLSEWGNFPEENGWGHHYKLRFKFKDGSSYEMSSPVKITGVHYYTAKEAEEIKNFDVIVYEKKSQFGSYNELFAISDVTFEGPNQYAREIYAVRAAIGEAERQVDRIDFETMSKNLEKAKTKLEGFLEKYPESEDKGELDRRFQVIQTYVDAYDAVKKAEESKNQEDIDKAKELIDLIPADESQGLTGRFKAIVALRERLGEIVVEVAPKITAEYTAVRKQVNPMLEKFYYYSVAVTISESTADKVTEVKYNGITVKENKLKREGSTISFNTNAEDLPYELKSVSLHFGDKIVEAVKK